jgi:hypothetical protein
MNEVDQFEAKEGDFIKDPSRLTKVQTSAIKLPSEIQMGHPEVVRGFAWKDRFMNSLCACGNNEYYLPFMLRQKPALTFDKMPKLPQNEGEPQKRREDLALKIKVNSTGSLMMDENVLHPYVKIHFVNMKTQKYLAKSDERLPGTYNNESLQYIDAGGNIQRAPVDYLLPMATQMNDLRIKGEMMAEWNEEFVINEKSVNIFDPETLILFEILDFNPDLAARNPSALNADLMYPVAWAYLRPVGMANIHVSTQRLQLYKYKFNYDKKFKYKRPIDQRTPEVLLDFNFPRKEEYPTYLEIDVSFVHKGDPCKVKHWSYNPWEVETGEVY